MAMNKATHTDYLLFSIVYFLQGALRLTGIAMPLFMRQELGLSISEIAVYSGIMSLPWTIKPIYGLLSDYIPLFKYRRKSYAIIASLLAIFGWIVTGSVSTITQILAAQILVELGIASLDVFIDGLAVQKSTSANRGLIQSICWGARSLGAIIAGFFGGYLLSFFTYRELFIISVIPLMFVLIFSIKVKEDKITTSKPFKKNIIELYKITLKNKRLGWVLLFLSTFFVSPSFGTVLFFHLKDNLAVSELSLGLLASTSSFGGFLGAIIYAKLLDKYKLKHLLYSIVIANIIFSMMYLFIDTNNATPIYFLNGMLGYITIISCMKLVAEICPKGGEATTFALVTSIINFAGSVVSPALGGWISGFATMQTLILISSLSQIVPLMILRKIE